VCPCDDRSTRPLPAQTFDGNSPNRNVMLAKV
jgi:hypothetical protein